MSAVSYTHLDVYKRQTIDGAPEGTRTPGPLLRRQMLYPAELQAHGPAGHGAGDGNRTHTTSLEGWGSTTELHPRDEAAHGPAALLIIAYSTALVKRFFRFFRDSDDAVGLIDVIVIRPHRPVFQLGGNRGGKPALLLDEQQAV